jgi:hypothetical protein
MREVIGASADRAPRPGVHDVEDQWGMEADARPVLERGQQVDWFSSDWIVFGLVIAVVALISLVISELRADEPVINFRLAQSRQAAACSRR